jgi:predicted kinase
MNELVVLIGLPGSGKSTLYRARYAATHALVSKDLLRGDKSSRQRALVEEHLRAGRSVVVDNTNVTVEDRARLVAVARAHGARVVAIYLDAPADACLQRNAQRAGRARVPAVAIFAARKKLVPPTRDEGFDALEVIAS